MSSGDKIVAEARTWLKTPFKHAANLKGIGVDCAHLVSEVFASLGMIHPYAYPVYGQGWWKHAPYEDYLLVDGLRESGFKETTDPRPGDVALLKLGKAYAHCVILTGNDCGVEAWPSSALVAEVKLSREKLWKGRSKKYFTVF